MENSNLDKLYNEYLTRSDTEIHIDGKRYVRLLHSERISIAGREFLIAYIPSTLNCRTGDTIQDENGNQFMIGTPVHMRFSRDIPEWYLNMPPWLLKWENAKGNRALCHCDLSLKRGGRFGRINFIASQ